ncbi:MAG: Trk system potassium transporter TrkA [Betaproteobacteria bacterium]|nr:Trk system potassium transporter TrkA [Betaproteobacteria bacterium]
MKIIILGAGRVGTSVAENLVSSEENDITVIDLAGELLSALQDRLDLRAVTGDGTLPSVLRDAGAENADLIIALTRSDQSNLVACKIAHRVFNIPTRVARLSAHDFYSNHELFTKENFAVDFAICPEQTVTEYISRLVEFPEALEVLDFAGGRVSLVRIRAHEDGLLVAKPIRNLRSHLLPGMAARIVALFRHNRLIIPDGELRLQPGDEVFIIAAAEHIRSVLREIRPHEIPVRRVMIAGGGNIGFRVAATLEAYYDVKVIEANKTRAEFIAEKLKNSLVLYGSATDEDLLEQENIAEMDLFLALTGSDADNIMTSSLAKRMGCMRVAALIDRDAYADMTQGGSIDMGISPAHISIGSLLARIRKGDVATVHSLQRGEAEALEIVAHGDPASSRIIGRKIDDIRWPRGVTVAALARNFGAQSSNGSPAAWRNGKVEIAHGDSVIQPGDRVIVFCASKKLVKQVEKLFQVGFHFF